MNNNPFLYRFFRPIFKIIFEIYYNPTIINANYIPSSGRI